MNKLFNRIFWHNNTTPALNESNLNAMSKGIDDIDNRVVDLAGDIMETIPQLEEDLETAQELIEDLEGLNEHTPYIGANGNWWVWNTTTKEYEDSGVDASISVQIADITMLAPSATPYVTNSGTATDPIFHLFIPRGHGIASVAKTSTSGLVDTYTMTFTDGSTFIYTVTNGADGVDGVDGKTAYESAVDGGYTGTESDFNAELADLPSYASSASASASHAEDSAEDSEAWAVGQRGGQDVPSTDPTYHNNAKYWSDKAQHASTLDALSDVDLANPSAGQALVYSSVGKWTNVTLPSASGDMRKAVYDPDDDGIIGIAQGGTGNADGYIRTGQLSGSTVGTGATIEGTGNTASGNYSHAEGSGVTASALGAHAEGATESATYGIVASGKGAHAEGYVSFSDSNNITASGEGSHAEGRATIASGQYAHAEGLSSVANADESHAEGNQTKASGQYAHAEGFKTVASGQAAHAEGNQTKASKTAHAEGYKAYANGDYSHAEGYVNTAGYANQHVQGTYNDNKSTTLFEIGNGTSANHKNIFEIYDDGYMSFDNGVNKIKFGVDANGRYGYIKAGADTVYPFKNEISVSNITPTRTSSNTVLSFTYTDRPSYFAIVAINTIYACWAFVSFEWAEIADTWTNKKAVWHVRTTSSSTKSLRDDYSSYISVSEDTNNKTITVTSSSTSYKFNATDYIVQAVAST